MKKELKWLITLSFVMILVQVKAQQVKHISARDPYLKHRVAPHLQKRIILKNNRNAPRPIPPRMKKITFKHGVKHR